MRILYLVSWYMRPSSPTSGYFFYQLAEGMTDLGVEAVVVNVHMKFFGIIDRKGLWQRHNGKLHEYMWYIPMLIPRWQWSYKKVGCRVMKRLIKKVEKTHGEFDIVHVQSAFSAAYYAKEYLQTCGIPVLYTEHSSAVLRDRITKYDQVALRVLDQTADETFAVSGKLAQALSKYVHHVSVLGNIVDVQPSPRVRSKGRFTFLSLSTLRRDKGLEDLIRAFSEEFDPTECVSLRIAGDGEHKDKLEEMIQALNNRYDITLVGHVPHDKVGEYFSQGDCFVLPSKYETFGIVYLEAMACGLPVIATQCGGPEDFLDETNGVMVPVGDVTRLRKAMRSMLINEFHFDQNKIAERVVREYGKESICKQYYDIYRRNCKKG